MAKLTTDNFGQAIEKLLEEYSDDVKGNLDVVTKKITQQGVKLLRSKSASMFQPSGKRSKKYSSSWTSSNETGRLSTQGTIYNTEYGLPHLLEKGHVLKNGTGRVINKELGKDAVPAYPHIAEVEEKIVEAFEREVKSKL